MELNHEKTHRACIVSIICEGGTTKEYLYAGKVLTGKNKSKINRGYYTVARRYEFYFERSGKTIFSERAQKIKFISSSRPVMFFLLYRQKDIDKKNRFLFAKK